jgi:diguanylate cyclase (GGDEF)-like protein
MNQPGGWTAWIRKDRRAALLAGILVVYILADAGLSRAYGSEVRVLSLLPVILVSWYDGLRAGLGFSAFMIVLNVLLALIAGPLSVEALVEGVVGSISLVCMAGVVGYLSDLRRTLAHELANRMQVESALRVSETFNRAILQALSASIAVLDRKGQIVEINEAWKSFARANGAREDRTGVGVNYLAVCRRATGDDAEVAFRTAAGIQAVMEGSENLFALEYACHSPTQKRWYLLHVTPLPEKSGVVVSHINITDRVQTEQKLEYLATHDALTGLYNRAYFEQEMARMQAEDICPVSVVMADLDGLKQVNDQLGHAAGDDLIRRTAEMLKHVFRSEDPVARMGGDEFAVLLPRIDEKMASTILRRVILRIEAANTGNTPPVRLSIGFATTLNSHNLPETLKLADQRMYENKLARRASL